MKLKNIYEKHKRLILLLIVIFFSVVWRFINYDNKWILNQDDARDVIIAKFAWDNEILTPLGPTSSAGPISFGPIYYWILSLFVSFSGWLVNGPWIVFTLLSVGSVLLVFLAAESLGGLYLGLIAGLLTAFSPAQVSYSATVTNPILSGVFAFVSFYFLARIIKKNKIIDWLMLGVAIGISTNSHYQSFGLVAIPIVLTFFKRESIKARIKYLAASFTGIVITFLPLVIFDLKNNFIWIKSILDYLRSGQGKFYLPIRWLSDLTVFWPEQFGEILLGYPKMGYLVISLLVFTLLIYFISFKKNQWLSVKEFLVIGIVFFVQVVIIRYYKGPRDNIYLLFVQPFVIYFVSWTFYKIFTYKKILGILLIFTMLSVAGYSNLKNNARETQTKKIFSIRDSLINKGYDNITLYSFGSSRMHSLPLYYLLDNKRLLTQNNKYVLIACDNFYQPVDNCLGLGVTYKDEISGVVEIGGYRVYEMNDFDEVLAQNMGLRLMNGENIFNEIYLNYPNLIK